MIVKEAMEIIENTRYYYTPSEEQLFMYTEALEFYMANDLDIKKEGRTFNKDKICGVNTTVNKVIITEKTRVKTIPLKTYFFKFFKSLAPNLWATGIAKPCVNPWQKPITKNCTLVVEPTPAKATLPNVWPTMAVSTIL